MREIYNIYQFRNLTCNGEKKLHMECVSVHKFLILNISVLIVILVLRQRREVVLTHSILNGNICRTCVSFFFVNSSPKITNNNDGFNINSCVRVLFFCVLNTLNLFNIKID